MFNGILFQSRLQTLQFHEIFQSILFRENLLVTSQHEMLLMCY